MRSLISELNRRNVFRVAVAYVVTAWVIMQVLELATDAFDAPAWTLKLAFTVLALGLVPAMVFSWVYELTPDGIRREADILPEQSVSTHTARRLDVAVLLLLHYWAKPAIGMAIILLKNLIMIHTKISNWLN